MKPRLGDQVHYAATDRRTGAPLPCRLAFISEVPKHLLREPFDGCRNGTEGLWIASIVAVGKTGLVFEEDLDYRHPAKPSDILDDDIPTSWHTADDCEEAS